ncbi:MAG TPA: MATE family efflux transporter [Thermoanaerobaculia bacterium]|nr:MATE family efflux transporter [Thermoanaerobaculia bacterium]
MSSSPAEPSARSSLRPLPIDRHSILALAWPVILTNLLTTAVSWVDLLMVSRLGTEPVAAVGLAGFMQTLAWAVLMSLQMGTAILVAQGWGRGDRDRVDHVTTQALVAASAVALAISAVVCWPGNPLLERAFAAFDAEPAVTAIGAGYLRVVLYALVAMTVALVGQAALRAIGDTRTPLWLTGVANLLNIIFNWLLIFGHLGLPELGAVGAAWGTVIARSCEALAYLAILASRRRGVGLRWASARPQRATLAELLRLGVPSGAEQLVINTGFLFYNRVIASYGTEALAAYQVGVILLQASFMPGFGFSVAATTLVGQWVGAGDVATAREAGRRCRDLAVLLMSALGVVFFFVAEPFTRFVLDDPLVVGPAVSFIRMLALSQPAMAIHFALSGALRGASDVRAPLAASIVAMYGVRLPIAAAAAFLLHAAIFWVWAAMVCAHTVRATLLSRRWRGERWEVRAGLAVVPSPTP